MHRAKKKFGQNFLHDEHVIEQILRSIAASSEHTLLEIGPGQGALSLPLLRTGAQLYVVEIDRNLIPLLEKKFAAFDKNQWHIFNEDALDFRLDKVPTATKGKLRVVGNLPYNISTPLLFHLMEQLETIEDMHFMLQKEVVDRICAQPGNKDYGRLSIILQYYCECEQLFDVPPESFKPVPKVNSAIVRLRPYEHPPHPCADTTQLSKLLAMAFSQRRKTLRNNLKKLDISALLEELGIDANLRAENISLAQYVRLCNSLIHSGKQLD